MRGGAGRARRARPAGAARDRAGQGQWDIPGGFLETDEHPEAGAIRELREETGLAITITGLLGIYLDGYYYDANDDTTLNLCYLATAEGEPVAADDAAAVAWFTPATLPPPDQIAFRHQLQVLEEWRRQMRNAGCGVRNDEGSDEG